LLHAYGSHRIKLYFDDEKNYIPVSKILEHQRLGTHLYVCGPAGMIDAVLQAGLDAGWPKEALHSERFLAPPPGEAFTVELVRSGRTVEVGEHQSILEAVEAKGIDAPYMCRGGACGQCETAVVSCDGGLEHNDIYLSDAEKASGQKIMICVSRIRGKALALDL
jgi:dimethylamine monooxygenase subunit B